MVITPSHNPPEDGGFKYNPPTAGPAGPEITNVVQKRANAILRDGLKEVRRLPLKRALAAGTTQQYEYVLPYVRDLGNVIEMDKLGDLRMGVDPMGGAAVNMFFAITKSS